MIKQIVASARRWRVAGGPILPAFAFSGLPSVCGGDGGEAGPVMNRHHTAYLLLALFAGCATSPAEENTASATKQDCRVEYRTGSALPVKECSNAMTEAERTSAEAERQRVIDALRTIIRPGMDPGARP